MRLLRLLSLVLGVSFLLALSPVAARAQSAEDEAITAARQKGVKYLKSCQKKDGSWDFTSHEVGISALCTVALIENGVELTDPAVQSGYEFVKKKARELKNTYDLSLAVVLLQRMGDRRDKPLVRSLAARLIAGQLETGGWTYTCPGAELDAEKVLRDPTSGPKPKEGFGDNSCTQFAVLGLWVASRVGVDIEPTLRRVTSRFEGNQTEDGGWSYAKDEKLPKQVSSPAMTGAGVFCLAVARAWELREAKKEAEKEGGAAAAPPRKSLLDDEIFAKGLKRSGEFAAGIGPGIGRYFLWSVERVGVLLGLEKLGNTEWFATGSQALLKDQKEDGSWPTAWPDTDKQALSDTCFAILFLRKANLGSDISRLLDGEYEEKFELANRQPIVRFSKLQEAVAAAMPGETIRVNGNGPWRLGHLELDKDITILAGHGFTPVFRFEVGRNKRGTRYRPETEPEGRDMVAVKSGRVTLEGLRLQMEPPRETKRIPWSAITVDGGELRLLNCSVSEINQQGTALVSWRAPGTLVVRNSQLMGGRVAIEADAPGEQQLVVDNSLAFTPQVVGLARSDKTEGDSFTCKIRHSVLQTKEFLNCGTYAGRISIDTEASAFQAEWLSSNLVKAGKNRTEGRQWIGSANLYDVKQWVGVNGKAVELKDAKEWLKLWGNTETDSFKRTAPFVGTRRLGNYNHEANVQDWLLEFPSNAEIPLQKNRVGIITYIAGPGIAYDQYRETIGYSFWKVNRLELSWIPPRGQLPTHLAQRTRP